MAKVLKQNVLVDGVWYGPSYPDNDVTSAVLDAITNPAAFEDTPEGNPFNGPGEVPGAAAADKPARRGRGKAAADDDGE